MLKGKFVRNYRSANGNPTFVYEVSGTQEELEAYKASQGEFHRVDEGTGKPLFFTINYNGNSVDLIITRAGRCVVDSSEMDKAASLAKQYGGNLGAEFAKQSAERILGNKTATPVANSQAQETPVTDGPHMDNV